MEGPVHGVLIAPQAASDADMVSLWLGNYRSANTRARYAADARAFVVFIAKPLHQVIPDTLMDAPASRQARNRSL
jgi:hypothetical protein